MLATRETTSRSEDRTDRVLRRIAALKQRNQQLYAQRSRIRDIMNGGEAGLKALVGDKVKIKDRDIPTANLILSGMERLGQDLQDPPDLKVDYPENRDDRKPKERAEKRRRIVTAYDEYDRIDMQMPQVGRWIPGYGFCVWTITERVDHQGISWPRAQLRDPYTCWPGYWGPDQQPQEVAFTSIVPVADLARIYPRHANTLLSKRGWERSEMGGWVLNRGESAWDNPGGAGVEVVEYIDNSGTYLAVPSHKIILSYVPNMLRTGPPFVIAKRFAFDALIGQFDHTIGLMAMMAKLNVLAVVAAGDAVFAETNIMGDMVSKQYRKGRNAQNFFTPGTRIEHGREGIAFQVFQEIDRMERQLRITQNYPVAADGISPMSFTTGEGVRELQGAASRNTQEHQKVLKRALQDLDAKRLEWDELCYPDDRKPLEVTRDGKTRVEYYTPSKDIAGQWRTRRTYGVMASWDEPSKLIGGIQLMAADAIDVETFQENLSGLDNIPRINERIAKKKASERLLELLTQEALQGNPAAKAALVELNLTGDLDRVLNKYFRPEEEEPGPTPEELAAVGQPGLVPGVAAQGAPPGGPPPPVSTVLSQLPTAGPPEGGVQTVGRL